jgi:hypothetical protein
LGSFEYVAPDPELGWEMTEDRPWNCNAHDGLHFIIIEMHAPTPPIEDGAFFLENYRELLTIESYYVNLFI